jgi:hypothetical protein
VNDQSGQYQAGPPQARRIRTRSAWSTASGVILAAIIAIWAYNHFQSSSGGTPCTSESCVISTIEQTLDGSSATDGAVFTRVTCSPSSLTDVGSGTWRADCTAHYSDGSTATGYGTLDTATNLVDFEPTGT